jgi:D-sedoheptulose 7-phosphate isomerase
MEQSSKILKNAVAAAKETLQSLVDLDSQVAKAADLIEQCLRAGNKLLVCGNGGSAADASHFATEFVVRFMTDRPAYPAICLAGDGGLLTAAGNDYGFDEIFARQVAAFGVPGDLLICLTTSGKSRNIERALQEAKARKLKTITFLGRDGGSTIGMADVDLLVRGDLTARIQEAHQLLLHVLCETIEVRPIGKKKASKRTKDPKVQIEHPRSPELSRVLWPKRFPAILAFLATARVRDPVADARLPLNFRFRIWKSCRVSDRSRCKHHPFPLNGQNAFGDNMEFRPGSAARFNASHQGSSGPAPCISMKRNAAPMLVQTTIRSLQA